MILYEQFLPGGTLLIPKMKFWKILRYTTSILRGPLVNWRPMVNNTWSWLLMNKQKWYYSRLGRAVYVWHFKTFSNLFKCYVNNHKIYVCLHDEIMARSRRVTQFDLLPYNYKNIDSYDYEINSWSKTKKSSTS